jgi:hypothetical protein
MVTLPLRAALSRHGTARGESHGYPASRDIDPYGDEVLPYEKEGGLMQPRLPIHARGSKPGTKRVFRPGGSGSGT